VNPSDGSLPSIATKLSRPPRFTDTIDVANMPAAGLHSDPNDQSGMSWYCPVCTDMVHDTPGGWMVDVVWSQLTGPPLTYLMVVWMVEEALIDHFATHTAALPDI
jgi:hypothetical protein